jgi:hypothetical protein
MMYGWPGQGFNTNVDPNLFNQNIQSMLEQESPEYGDGIRQSEIYAHNNHESNDTVVISFNWFRLRKHAANTNYFARIAQSFMGIATTAYAGGSVIAPVDIYEGLVRHIAAPNCAGMRNMALVIRRDEFSKLDHALARNLDGICIGESKGSTMYRDSKRVFTVHGVSRLDVSLEAFGKIAGDRASNSAANEALLVIGNLLGRPIAHNGFWVFSFADPRPGLGDVTSKQITDNQQRFIGGAVRSAVTCNLTECFQGNIQTGNTVYGKRLLAVTVHGAAFAFANADTVQIAGQCVVQLAELIPTNNQCHVTHTGAVRCGNVANQTFVNIHRGYNRTAGIRGRSNTHERLSNTGKVVGVCSMLAQTEPVETDNNGVITFMVVMRIYFTLTYAITILGGLLLQHGLDVLVKQVGVNIGIKPLAWPAVHHI